MIRCRSTASAEIFVGLFYVLKSPNKYESHCGIANSFFRRRPSLVQFTFGTLAQLFDHTEPPNTIFVSKISSFAAPTSYNNHTNFIIKLVRLYCPTELSREKFS